MNVSLLLSLASSKILQMNLKALSMGLPAVIETSTRILNPEYRLVTHPTWRPPFVNFEVIYKPESLDEVNLGRF